MPAETADDIDLVRVVRFAILQTRKQGWVPSITTDLVFGSLSSADSKASLAREQSTESERPMKHCGYSVSCQRLAGLFEQNRSFEDDSHATWAARR